MKKLATMGALVILLGASAIPAQAQDGDDPVRPDGWDEYSHGKDTDPDYSVVFPDAAVNSLTITISPETWQAMLDDMTNLYGEFGSQSQMGGMGQPPQGFDPGQMPEGAGPGQMPEGAGMMDFGTDQNPVWVAVDVAFNGQTWTKVGMRFKGNSSLASTWSGGVYKLPFKLDFDQFEDDYPEIDNQRFYGFQQVSFSSNWSDDSLLREKITADIFRESGVPAAQTAFYAVYVDYGEGPVYFGVYTAVEVVDDTVIETQFADDSGNVYKPEGTGATFAADGFTLDSFEKETNEDEADYSDVEAMFEALHAETRTSDPAAWRSGLEAAFDVDGFLRWLAVNTVVQNWDTYGQMAHNYYLYNDAGQLTWIPWDNNMAMMAGMGGGFGGPDGQMPGGQMPGGQMPGGQMPDGQIPGGQMPGSQGENGQQMQPPDGQMPGGGMGGQMPGGSMDGITLDLESVGDNWPLIRFLMDDASYHACYVTYVEETINGAFEPSKVSATMQAMHDLIAPYVLEETEGYTNLSSPDAFDSALTELLSHVNERYTAAQTYITSQQE